MHTKLLSTPKGFTLVELLVVLTIIGILLSIALPNYQRYSARTKFTEIYLLADQYKKAALIAVQVNGANITDLDSGKFGIPNEQTDPSQYIANIAMRDGVLKVVSKNIYASTVTLDISWNATLKDNVLSWILDLKSSCRTYDLCE